MKKATIADVARLAGVSIKTVSRVANREPNVSDSTRARVQEAIDALGYRPDPSARSLASRRSWLIGLLYDNPSASYLVNIQFGALAVSRAEGYDVVIHPCDYQDERLPREIASMVAQSKVEGVILTPPLSDMNSISQVLEETGTPYARIAPADRRPDKCEVYTNDREACAEMTRYLASLGHRRIAFIVGHPDHGALQERLAGYREGLAASGIEMDKRLIAQGYNSFESGVECARALLDSSNRPTAVFASNDDMAAGTMKVAHEMGLEIPTDLSVAGFDDVPLAAQLWPSLTTIRQPIEEMARRATELLLHELRGHVGDEPEKIIESTLVVRDSTGPVPA